MRPTLEQTETIERLLRVVSPKYGIIKNISARKSVPGMPRYFGYGFLRADCAEIGGGKMLGFGAGLSPSEALISGLGECVERYCADFVPRRGFRGISYNELRKKGLPAIDPAQFSFYADFQYKLPAFHFQRFDADAKSDWIDGVSLMNNEPILVPMGLVVSKNRPQDFIQNTTNGNACGSTREQAILNGLLEIIERDAAMFHWWTKTPLKKLNVWSTKDPIINVFKEYLGHNRERFEFYLAQSPLPFPTVISTFTSNGEQAPPAFSMSGGCHLDPISAFKKSALELSSITNSMTQRSELWKTEEDNFEFDQSIKCFDQAINFYARKARPEIVKPAFTHDGEADLSSLRRYSANSHAKDLNTVVSALAVRGFNPIAVDFTTRDVRACGFHVYKAIVPGMIDLNSGHKYRRWGNPRLLKNGALKISDLNHFPHPFP